MAVSGGTFREVCTNSNQNWKDITVPIGEGQSSNEFTEEHKSISRAGGYGYKDSNCIDSPCRNRFIYWRYSQGVLELVEESLDFTLKGNGVRLHFVGASLVGDISIHESHGSVLLLVTTTTAVHRLIFPHPNKLQKYDASYIQMSDRLMPSIFTDVSVFKAMSPGSSHNFNQTGLSTSYQIHTSSSWLTKDGKAIFAMATNRGSILLVTLPPYGLQGVTTQHELKQSSVMKRLWSGFVPSVIRGSNDDVEWTSSLVLHALGQNVFVFSVSRDHKIRMWSCKDYDCVMAVDMLEFLPYNANPAKLKLKGEGHIIKQSAVSSKQALYLAVFLNFTDSSQFSIFEPVFADGRYQLLHVTDVFGPQSDLIDFCVADGSLWMLWSSADGDVFISSASIDHSRMGLRNMNTVISTERKLDGLEVPGHLEPREYYIEQIFCPGKFNLLAIIRTLNIFKRSLDNSQVPDSNVPVEVLKSEVLAAIEQEIKNSASDYSVSDEEYHNLQLQQWAKFYSCCVQYHERSTKPLGLFADNENGLIAVVKKDTISFYRLGDCTEQLYLSESGQCSVEHFDKTVLQHEDEALFASVIELCDCLKIIAGCLTEELIYSFEQDLYHTQSPVTVAGNIITWLVNNNDYVGQQQTVFTKLQNIQHLGRVIEILINMLDLTNKHEPMIEDNGSDSWHQVCLSRLFSSTLGTCVLGSAIHQVAQCGLDLSRDLLLLLTLIGHLTEQAGVSESVLEQIQSDLMSKVCLLVRAYYILKWSSEVLNTSVTASQLETNLHLLEALGFLDVIRPVSVHNVDDCRDSLIMELFIKSEGGQRVKEVLNYSNVLEDGPSQFWNKCLLLVVKAFLQTIWPFNSCVTFPMFLIGHCQYTVLQEYLRLAEGWCDVNTSTRNFFQGIAYFACSETQKAVDCFLEVPLDVGSEDFLSQLVMAEHDTEPRMIYYLKVLSLLEQFQHPHLAISVAKNAISVAREGSEFLPTLWSKMFKNELELGHNEDAYTAMLANPDKDRRRDCLRQFLVVLCERSELQTLVSLPYRDKDVVLEDEVVSILESRARSIDLNKQNYYDLLYSFHVFRQNYRKAGSIMYEYGIRQGREISGLKGLQKQAKCYLAALNALRLVNPQYAWIVKPLSPSTDLQQSEGLPSKRDFDGNEFRFSKKCQIDVLELDDIVKEYILVHARLQLLQTCPEPGYMAGPTLSAPETVGLLVNAGLFDSAINICKLFKLSLVPVFEGLTLRCVSLAENSSPYMQGDNKYTSEAWKWLAHNEMVIANTVSDSSSTDQVWRLLHSLLSRFEDGTGVYHKCVAVTFLSRGFPLPAWLEESYKKLDAAALLRLYLDYNKLEEASHLALEFIDAVRGKGKEYFGLKTCLHVGAPPVWLPYTSIDQLITALDEEKTDPYVELSERIQDKLELYFSELKQVSEDMLMSAGTKQYHYGQREHSSGYQ